MIERTIWTLRVLTACTFAVLLVGLTTVPTEASNGYGEGVYGSCTYGTCAITLTSSGTINVDVVPTSSTSCTVNDDSVAVTTDSSTGYTLSFTDNATNNDLIGTSTSVSPVSGSQASPSTLSANTWGYRVDGVGGFGSGPTSTISNASPPSLTFAPVPSSSLSPDTLVSSSSPADPTVTTQVWYGLCTNLTTPAGTYASNVVYTAIVN